MADFFVNRKQEMKIFNSLLRGSLVEKIICIQDNSGQGKSFLLREFQKLAREQRFSTVLIEFGQDAVDYLDFCRDVVQSLQTWDFSGFEKIDREYNSLQTLIYVGGGNNTTSGIDQGENITNKETSFEGIAGRDYINIGMVNVSDHINDAVLAERQRKIKFEISKAFLNDCYNNKDKRVIMFLDACEKCNLEMISWLEKWIFSPIRSGKLNNLLCVLAGRPEMKFFMSKHLWSSILLEMDELTPLDYESVKEYFNERRKLPIPMEHIQAYYQLVRKDPLLMGQIADRLVRK